MAKSRLCDSPCSIARTLAVVGDPWSVLILRDAFFGTTRFADFRASLGIAPDVLSARLAALVDEGVLERRPYQEPGRRARDGYHLTPAGRDLKLVLGALQQWGDDHRPREEGPTVARRAAGTGHPLAVAFVDDEGAVVEATDATFAPTAAYPRATAVSSPRPEGRRDPR